MSTFLSFFFHFPIVEKTKDSQETGDASLAISKYPTDWIQNKRPSQHAQKLVDGTSSNAPSSVRGKMHIEISVLLNFEICFLVKRLLLKTTSACMRNKNQQCPDGRQTPADRHILLSLELSALPIWMQLINNVIPFKLFTEHTTCLSGLRCYRRNTKINTHVFVSLGSIFLCTTLDCGNIRVSLDDMSGRSEKLIYRFNNKSDCQLFHGNEQGRILFCGWARSVASTRHFYRCQQNVIGEFKTILRCKATQMLLYLPTEYKHLTTLSVIKTNMQYQISSTLKALIEPKSKLHIGNRNAFAPMAGNT